MPWTRAIPSLIHCQPICLLYGHLLCIAHRSTSRYRVVGVIDIPDGQDTAGLGEASLLLDTADSLLEDRGDLSWGGLGLSGRQLAESPEKTQTAARGAPKQLPTIIMYRASISIELR